MKRKFHGKNWKSFCHRWPITLQRDHGVWCGFDLAMIHVKISPADTTKHLTIGSDRTRSKKRWVYCCEWKQFFKEQFSIWSFFNNKKNVMNSLSVKSRLHAAGRQKAIWRTRTHTLKLIVCPKLVNHSTEYVKVSDFLFKLRFFHHLFYTYFWL